MDLESDLRDLARYIEIAEDNFEVYSTRIVSLLLSASSEVDAVAKLLCGKLNPKSKAKNIGDYGRTIASRTAVAPFRVEMPDYGIVLHPWRNWEESPPVSPQWWRCHNNVKHERDKYFREATLGNLLNAVSGLFVLLIYLHREDAAAGRLGPDPSLLRPKLSYVEAAFMNKPEQYRKYPVGS